MIDFERQIEDVLPVEHRCDASCVTLSFLHVVNGVEIGSGERIGLAFSIGEKGDKPVKGEDYFTDEDIAEVEERIKEGFGKEIEQIKVEIDSSMRNMRVNYELNKVPEIKMIDQEGNQLCPRIVYGEGFAWVYWQEKVNGLILIN